MSWDFALILFILLLVTGVVWAADYFYLRAKRRRAGEAAMAVFDAAPTGMGTADAARLRQEAYDRAHRVNHVAAGQIVGRGYLCPACRLRMPLGLHQLIAAEP